VAERSGDTAFTRTERGRTMDNFRPHESGVALRFPPHSKTSRNQLPFEIRMQFGLNRSRKQKERGMVLTTPRS
jgi:hypothetical protein